MSPISRQFYILSNVYANMIQSCARSISLWIKSKIIDTSFMV